MSREAPIADDPEDAGAAVVMATRLVTAALHDERSPRRREVYAAAALIAHQVLCDVLEIDGFVFDRSSLLSKELARAVRAHDERCGCLRVTKPERSHLSLVEPDA